MNEEKEILSYTLVLHSAREKLEITLNEYAVADSIYHLSNNPKSDLPVRPNLEVNPRLR
jgi:hypothetical protein